MKENLKIPSRHYPFEKDVIDEMMDYETGSVFNMEQRGMHDPTCKSNRLSPQKDVTCCEPLIKNFNRYNQKSYLDQ